MEYVSVKIPKRGKRKRMQSRVKPRLSEVFKISCYGAQSPNLKSFLGMVRVKVKSNVPVDYK